MFGNHFCTAQSANTKVWMPSIRSIEHMSISLRPSQVTVWKDIELGLNAHLLNVRENTKWCSYTARRNVRDGVIIHRDVRRVKKEFDTVSNDYRLWLQRSMLRIKLNSSRLSAVAKNKSFPHHAPKRLDHVTRWNQIRKHAQSHRSPRVLEATSWECS